MPRTGTTRPSLSSSTRHDLSVTIGRMSRSQFPSVCLASADDCCLSLSLSRFGLTLTQVDDWFINRRRRDKSESILTLFMPLFHSLAH